MDKELAAYHIAHQRLKEAVQLDADKETLLNLTLDAEEALIRYREGLERA